MSELATHDKPDVKMPAGGRPQSGSSTMQMVLVGILVLAAAALITYQFIGCAACYGARYPI